MLSAYSITYLASHFIINHKNSPTKNVDNKNHRVMCKEKSRGNKLFRISIEKKEKKEKKIKHSNHPNNTKDFSILF